MTTRSQSPPDYRKMFYDEQRKSAFLERKCIMTQETYDKIVTAAYEQLSPLYVENAELHSYVQKLKYEANTSKNSFDNYISQLNQKLQAKEVEMTTKLNEMQYNFAKQNQVMIDLYEKSRVEMNYLTEQLSFAKDKHKELTSRYYQLLEGNELLTVQNKEVIAKLEYLKKNSSQSALAHVATDASTEMERIIAEKDAVIAKEHQEAEQSKAKITTLAQTVYQKAEIVDKIAQNCESLRKQLDIASKERYQFSDQAALYKNQSDRDELLGVIKTLEDNLSAAKRQLDTSKVAAKTSEVVQQNVNPLLPKLVELKNEIRMNASLSPKQAPNRRTLRPNSMLVFAQKDVDYIVSRLKK